MYRLQPVQDELIKRVGFRQTTQPKIPQLESSLTLSESGIFVQDRHSLLNMNNIYQIAENYDMWPYPIWAAPALGDEYDLNDYVRHNNIVYVSTIAVNSTEPGTLGAEWDVVDNFSQFLSRIKLSAAQKTIEKPFQYKKLEKNTKSVFENIHIFDGAGNRNTMIVKLGRFVGFQIRLRKHRHLTALIRKIGTQFSNLIPDPLVLYLYHSSQLDPIAQFSLNITEPVSFQWHNIPDITLPYVSDTQDAGGVFYLGYYEEDLPVGVQAIRKDNYSWDKPPCTSCGNYDNYYFQKWSAYMEFIPIVVLSNYLDPLRKKFENHNVGYTYNSNFGLNLHLSCKCDLTDFLIENINLLDEAYANMIANELLTAMAFNQRDGGDAKQVRVNAGIELNRTDPGSIAKMIEYSFKALNYDMSGFNTVCLPDAPRRGARTGSTL